MPRALIVEDDPETRSALSELVELEGFDAVTVESVAQAREAIASQPPDVILSDLMLPGGTGLDLLRDLDGPGRPELILITGHASVDSAIEALRNGARDYLTKPIDIPRLKSVLAHVKRTLALEEEISDLRGQLRNLGRFGRMIGRSKPMQVVYDLLARVGPTEASVLVTGESGTGKELVALTIHELSPRRRGPFVPVNCGAVPGNLIESELFGHERGSFTGATQQHRGVFERASGGTLFLDEITEMPAELQTKLLRVLETGTIMRVGGEDSIAVDVRLIAASNRSPEAAIREGTLREDLFYRINVFPIHLPSLRERGGDVVLLAEHFLTKHNEQEGTAKRFSEEARERLANHPWSGNVRELRNAVQRAFILAEEIVEMGFLDAPSGPAPGRAPGGAVDDVRPGMKLADVERQMILSTLDQCGGNKKRTAELLGISLKTLYNRLNQYGAGARGSGGD